MDKIGITIEDLSKLLTEQYMLGYKHAADLLNGIGDNSDAFKSMEKGLFERLTKVHGQKSKS